jgi:hypothetical protein
MSTPITHMQKTGQTLPSVLQKQPSRITENNGEKHEMPSSVFDAIKADATLRSSSNPALVSPSSSATETAAINPSTCRIIAAAALNEPDSPNTEAYLGLSLSRTTRGNTPHPFLADIRKANGSFLKKKDVN